MQPRKQGRPSGTDGSDFSYRMVVDSRYTKVAKGKSRVYVLILTQAVIQLIRLLCIVLSISKENGLNTLATSSSIVGLISLLIGELGRRRSRVSFLRVYIITSSIAILLALFCAISSNSKLEIIWNFSDLERLKFELTVGLVEIPLLLLGLVVQIITVITVVSLIVRLGYNFPSRPAESKVPRRLRQVRHRPRQVSAFSKLLKRKFKASCPRQVHRRPRQVSAFSKPLKCKKPRII